MLLEPKEVEIGGKTYIIHKFPAVQGREIVCKYPMSALPKLGDYQINEETMIKLMSYVGVKIEGRADLLLLQNMDLINNHVIGWDNLIGLEKLVLEYNNAFFVLGRILNFWQDFAQNLRRSSFKTLTRFLELLSKKIKQHSTS